MTLLGRSLAIDAAVVLRLVLAQAVHVEDLVDVLEGQLTQQHLKHKVAIELSLLGKLEAPRT